MFYWKDAFGPATIVSIKGDDRMKKCHACRQKLPLKVGDVVEGQWLGHRFVGLVTALQGAFSANVLGFDRWPVNECPVNRLTRVHGYYRITEREPLA